MAIAPLSNDNIKVGYITDDGYVSGVSLTAANKYEKLNPETVFIFINGDKKVKYLTIDEVNALTTTDLLRSDPCNVGPQPCPPPTLEFFGGGGVGAEANPVVDSQGNLIAVDIVSGGFGYQTPPSVQVIDPCRNGTGAVLSTEIQGGVVVRVIVNDSGQGYLPPKSSVPQYPAIIQLSEVRVDNQGLNYNCGVDEIVVEPANGSQLAYDCDSFGKIRSVSVLKPGNFTDLPNIRMKTRTGINARFTPVFDVIRDPQPVEPVIGDIVQVFDLVGLNINGYIDGKEYYGNVYFVNGVKFAGTTAKSGTNIRVFETRESSISRQSVPVSVTIRDDDTIQTTTPTTTETITAEPEVAQPTTNVTTTSTPTTTTTPTTTSTPTTTTSSDPSPSPAPSPPPSDGGGYGGY